MRRGHAPERGRWSLPGGRSERGEAPARTARRETFEETGLVVAIASLIGSATLHTTEGDFLVWNYAARRTGGRLRSASDASEAAYVSSADLLALQLSAGLLDWLTGWGILTVSGRFAD